MKISKLTKCILTMVSALLALATFAVMSVLMSDAVITKDLFAASERDLVYKIYQVGMSYGIGIGIFAAMFVFATRKLIRTVLKKRGNDKHITSHSSGRSDKPPAT